MKNLILFVSTLFVVSTGFAAGKPKAAGSYSREYGLAGCGLGSLVIGKRSAQIFASTTNGTLSNQWFAITFGTSNCVDGPTNEVASNMDRFIIANRAALTADVAKGDGETLSALSQVMGCDVQSQEMGRVLKANYNQIFAEDAQANIVTDSIITVIRSEAQVASRCNLG